MRSLLVYFENVLEKIKVHVYIWLLIIPYILYFLAFIGIWSVDPSYFRIISVTMQIYVALFLMIRFHPFRKQEIRPNDDYLILGSAFLLLANAGVTSFLTRQVVYPIESIANSIKK
jgi:hypothetical protein